MSSRKGHQGLPVETHPHELASAQATQGPRASEEDALLFFGRADPVPQTPKNSEDNRGSERHRRPRDDTPLPRVVTGDWPTVIRSKADPRMGIEERHFLTCRGPSIRSSRTRNGSAKKGNGRTGSTGPHEGDRGRVEAKTQTRMIGTAPMEITNPVGSTIPIGLVQIRPTSRNAFSRTANACSNSARAVLGLRGMRVKAAS